MNQSNHELNLILRFLRLNEADAEVHEAQGVEPAFLAKLQKMAHGKCDEQEIRDICREIKNTPQYISFLAREMRREIDAES